MPRKPKNHGKEWTPSDNRQLKQLARKDTPTEQIARKLKRTTGAIRVQAHREDISLKPKDKSY